MVSFARRRMRSRLLRLKHYRMRDRAITIRGITSKEKFPVFQGTLRFHSFLIRIVLLADYRYSLRWMNVSTEMSSLKF